MNTPRRPGNSRPSLIKEQSIHMMNPRVSETKELADKVLKAAEGEGRSARISLSLAELRTTGLRLHGREADIKFLRTKLQELRWRRDSNNNFNGGSGSIITTNNNRVTNRLRSSYNGGSIITTNNNGVTKRQLRSSYNGAKKDMPPELLLVAGVSGSGKSALVMRGLADPARKMGVAFAGGKFDLNNRTIALPLAAFVDAMASLTKFIVANDYVRKIREEIGMEFGDVDDMILLVHAMTGCEELFPIDEEVFPVDALDRSLRGGDKEAVMRLQYATRRLLKVVCKNLKGVVLFIDDLQWSDTATLDLIRSISLDTEIPSLLIVGSYREEEVSDSHPLALHIRELKEQMGASITTISVENLSPSDVTSLVAEVLRMEDNEKGVASLAASVYKKTEGNAFFVLMFLRYLYDEELIQYNFGVMKWLWNDSAVSSTMVMQNVATVMIKKLKRFQEGSQNILKVASCLGASFSTSVITMVVEEILSQTERASITDCDEIASLVTSSVGEFEKDGIWESESSEDVCRRRFSHDQIQSAAFELIPLDQRDSFRGSVGNALMKRLDPDSLEDCLFEAVSLRNCGMSSMSGDERKALAKMNLRAGLKASKNASFKIAAKYFESGRELLGRSWGVDPDTMLRLCSEEANARFAANDNIEIMNMLVDEVMNQPIPVQDKFKVSTIKIKSALAAGNLHESLDIALGFCRKLGMPVPKNKPVSKLVIMKEYIKTTRALKNRTAEEIACLPKLNDELIIMGHEMLQLANSACYLAQPSLLPIIQFLMIRSSLKHGISVSSCVAFTGLGLFMCAIFGKLKEGREMAKACELILANHDFQRMKCRSNFICEVFVLHWTAPIQSCFASLLESYQVGLQTGDIENAGWCLSSRCQYLYYSGRSLEGLQTEISTCIDILSQLNLESIRQGVLPFLLAVMKLRGVDVAEDDCMDFDTMLKVASEMGNTANYGRTIFLQMELLAISQEWERASELLIEAGNLRRSGPGNFVGVRFTALDALISLKVAQKSSLIGRMKWKRRAKKSIKLLRSWAKNGNVNVVHSIHILSAELAVLEGNGKKAEQNFKLAVKVAARNGFLQDKALAHECAKTYYSAKGDNFWAGFHHKCSQETYFDWGAISKVEDSKRQKRRDHL